MSKFIRIGQKLFNQFIDNDRLKQLFINEDLQLLRNSFNCQNELINYVQMSSNSDFNPLNGDNLIEKIENFIIGNSNKIYILSAVIASTTAILSGDTFINVIIYVVILIIISIIIICSTRKSAKHFWDNSLISLAKQISDERQTFIKLKELIDDYGDNNNDSLPMKNLAKNFQDIGIRCAMDFRAQTLALKELLPLKQDIDDNLISSLPDDLYDSYQNNNDYDDDSNFLLNKRTLKSLRQLIRLQISEFFKRILLIFIENYHDFNSNNDSTIEFTQKLSNVSTTNEIENIIKSMLDNSKCRQDELMKIISFHKSFYLQSEDTVTDDKCKNKSKKDNEILWQNCRHIRRMLYRSMATIDSCETILNQTDLNEKMYANIDDHMKLISDNLIVANETIQNIQNFLHKKKFPKHTVPSIQQPPPQQPKPIVDNNQNQTNEKKLIIIENEPPKDEVFEALVSENNSTKTNCLDQQTIDDTDDVLQMENKIKNLEKNMLNELRTAIKDKHIEHRVREARVQGIDVDREQIAHEYDESLQQTTEPQKELIKQNQMKNEPVMGFQFQFDLNLAMRDMKQNLSNDDNQLSWCLNVNNNEETFGDDSNDDEVDSAVGKN